MNNDTPTTQSKMNTPKLQRYNALSHTWEKRVA